MSGAFFDSNVLLYFASDDEAKSATAAKLLSPGGWISVQVLNEVANVARRKMSMDWDELGDLLRQMRGYLKVAAVTVATHDRGIALARRHRLSIYDAMIVAAALESGCDTLYSEDMHAGLVVGDRLTIVNPFA